MKRPQDTVPKPAFPIPTLTQKQQDETGLPADFWDAFDLCFAGVDVDADEQMLADHFGFDVELISEVKRTADGNLAHRGGLSGLEKRWKIRGTGGWPWLVLVVGPSEKTPTRIRLQGELAAAARRIQASPWQKRVMLDQIRRGEAPVWAFLPATEAQRQRLKRVWQRHSAIFEQMKTCRGIEKLAGAIDFVDMSPGEVEDYFRGLGLPDEAAHNCAVKVHFDARCFSRHGGVAGLKQKREEIYLALRRQAEAEYRLGWPGHPGWWTPSLPAE